MAQSNSPFLRFFLSSYQNRPILRILLRFPFRDWMVKYLSSVLKTVAFELKDASLNELLKAGLFGKKC